MCRVCAAMRAIISVVRPRSPNQIVAIMDCWCGPFLDCVEQWSTGGSQAPLKDMTAPTPQVHA